MPDGENSPAQSRGWFLSITLVIIIGTVSYIHLLRIQERAQDCINKVLIEANQDVNVTKKVKAPPKNNFIEIPPY